MTTARTRILRRVMGVGLALALVYPALPWASEYVMHVMTLVLVYMVLAMGLNIVPGFCGLLDLGFVGFYGIGAYTSGLLTIHYGMPFWFIVPLAALNGALWGILLGAPTLRLTGDYFAIVTFGFSELVVLFLTNEIWLTRGPLGLPGIDPVSLDLSFLNEDWFWEFFGERPYFYLAVAMAALVYVIVRRVEDSRLGRAWFALREDPLAAASCGVNILNYKVIAFAISAGIGALGGSFFARWTMFLSPDMFKFWESFLVLCMVVLGGLGNVSGALVGAVILVCLGEVLREVLPALGMPPEVRFLAYGLIMVLIMRFKPSGFFPNIADGGRGKALWAEERAAGARQKEESGGTTAAG
ncbi:branched-chain amino acid ABC transporter permease [Desulfobaculum sp. SPO524]|uniref:branched-chain amino acid ABC transporter permease n=1 Tax=Desulfobaculum sp. SPO524 TaxID=3378071 RepID=UPI0038548A3D